MRKLDPVKHEEKRQEILSAAERCFARDGLHGATISLICREAKISAGHLYHYFDSKETMIEVITARALEAASSIISQIMEGTDIVASLLEAIDAARRTGNRHGNYMFFDMLTEAGRSPRVGEILQEFSHKLWQMLAKVIAEAQRRGQIDAELDPAITARILLSMLDGAKTISMRDAAQDPGENIKVLGVFIERALRPQK
jgi:AcrR family transcriptional regulator